MPRDVSWKQEIALAVGQQAATKHIDDVRVRGVFAGVVAPDFEAATLDGKPFKLSNLRGKVVLLDFWATRCAPCVAELPIIQRAYQECAASGFEVVSISFDRNAETARKFVSDKQFAWTQLWADRGDKGPLADQYGVSAIPATFLIARDGTVIDRDLRDDALLQAVRKATSRDKIRSVSWPSSPTIPRFVSFLPCSPEGARDSGRMTDTALGTGGRMNWRAATANNSVAQMKMRNIGFSEPRQPVSHTARRMRRRSANTVPPTMSAARPAWA